MTLAPRYRAFISSTSLDLGGARQQVARFLKVLPTELVAMEDFGSDEALPRDLCLARVAQCNVFIGIYAQRYGHIDPGSGQSITELEYRQAAAMLAAGKMRFLLLYIIDPDALWPVRFNDDDPVAVGQLRQFKSELSSLHTVSTFKQADELPFLILRDMIQKMGVGREVLLPKTTVPRSRITHLQQPIGMDMFRPEHVGLFRGRDQDREALVRQVTREPVSLLLGASGVGKSSLIQAGLLPELERLGWLVIPLRPFENLRASLAHQVWAHSIQGVAESGLSLYAAIQFCRQAHADRMVLLVFDQFEDVMLPALRSEIPALLSDLYPLQNGADDRLRMLFSYRSDAEGDIGPIWQRLSRSTAGYARTYLGPLTLAEAIHAMTTLILAYARPGETPADDIAVAVDAMAVDLASESERNGFDGVYPPYLQIVLNEVVSHALAQSHTLTDAYRDMGGTHKIVQDFLMGQLRHFGTQSPEARRVLVALVRSHGTKSQRSTEHIAEEVRLDAAQLSFILQRLMDLRLVRQVESGYEVAHDFLARRIIEEVATSEELARKRSHELLESKVAAYGETSALLSLSEYLFLYRRREALHAGLEQIIYLLQSAIPLKAPGCFWLRALDATQVAEVLGRAGTSAESTRTPPSPGGRNPQRSPTTIHDLLHAVESPLRHERDDAIGRLSRVRDLGTELSSLAGRRSPRARYAAVQLRMRRTVDKDLGWCLKNISAKTVATRCDAAIGLAHHPEAENLERLHAVANDPKVSMRLQYSGGYSAGCIAATLGLQVSILSPQENTCMWFLAGAIAGIAATAHECPTSLLIPLLHWQFDLRSEIRLAMATLMERGVSTPWHVLNDGRVEGLLYCNELLAAVAATGDGEQVLRYVELLRVCEHAVDVRFDHRPIGMAAAALEPSQRMVLRELMDDWGFGGDFHPEREQEPGMVESEDGDADPDTVPRVYAADDWANSPAPQNEGGVEWEKLETYFDEIDDFSLDEPPPWIACEENAYYLRWLVGCLFADSAGPEDTDVLYRLARHNYWHIRASALERLANVLNLQDMPRLIDEIYALQDSSTEIAEGLLNLARKLDASAYPFVDPSEPAVPTKHDFGDLNDGIPF